MTEKRIIIGVLLLALGLISVSTFLIIKNYFVSDTQTSNLVPEGTQVPRISPSPLPVALPSLTPISIPSQKIIPNSYHTFQTFNNCGPAALSMALSYYDIRVSQQELGQALRPYQHTSGDNDDKSTTLAELAEKSKEYGLVPYHRPNGSPEMVKQFIANDIPVITRTWLKKGEDIGHYRVIKGYDETTLTFIQDDSLQGANLSYSYDDFDDLWQAFNYEFLVLVPPEKESIAERILGSAQDERVAWQNALESAENELTKDPSNIYTKFNISVAHYYLGNYEETIRVFESVQSQLPSRMLWYQIEPIQAYQKLGRSTEALTLINHILTHNNRAFSELYHIRGEIYLSQGNVAAAQNEFETALLYNRNFMPAAEALAQL